MLKRATELKNKATERAEYYNKINFPILSREFTEFANFLAEIEAHLRLQEKQNEEECK